MCNYNTSDHYTYYRNSQLATMVTILEVLHNQFCSFFLRGTSVAVFTIFVKKNIMHSIIYSSSIHQVLIELTFLIRVK